MGAATGLCNSSTSCVYRSSAYLVGGRVCRLLQQRQKGAEDELRAMGAKLRQSQVLLEDALTAEKRLKLVASEAHTMAESVHERKNKVPCPSPYSVARSPALPPDSPPLSPLSVPEPPPQYPTLPSSVAHLPSSTNLSQRQ